MEAATLSTDTVCYLYGLVRPPVSVQGLNPVEDGSRIMLVDIGDVGCAITPVSARDYDLAASAASSEQQLAWLTPRVWRHHEVLCGLHAASAVVPLKFGTLCPTVAEVENLLRQVHDAAAALLERFAGKDEWTLQLRIDESALSHALQERDPALVAMQEAARDLPEGRAFFARKMLQKATADIVAARLAEIARSIERRLSHLDMETAAGSRGRGTAVLVPRDRFAHLKEVLSELEEEHAMYRVTFELVGPWPPYSFATSLETATAAAVAER